MPRKVKPDKPMGARPLDIAVSLGIGPRPELVMPTRPAPIPMPALQLIPDGVIRL